MDLELCADFQQDPIFSSSNMEYPFSSDSEFDSTPTPFQATEEPKAPPPKKPRKRTRSKKSTEEGKTTRGRKRKYVLNEEEELAISEKARLSERRDAEAGKTLVCPAEKGPIDDEKLDEKRRKSRQAAREFRMRQKLFNDNTRKKLEDAERACEEYRRRIDAVEQENTLLHARIFTLCSGIQRLLAAPGSERLAEDILGVEVMSIAQDSDFAPAMPEPFSDNESFSFDLDDLEHIPTIGENPL